MASPLCSNFSHLFLMVQVVCKIFIHFSGFSIWDWDMDWGCREFEIQPSCVRSPWQSLMTQYPTFSKLPENNQRCNVRHDIPSGAAGIFCSLIPRSAVGLEGCRGVNEIPPPLRFWQEQKQKKSLQGRWITTCLPDFQIFLRPCNCKKGLKNISCSLNVLKVRWGPN